MLHIGPLKLMSLANYNSHQSACFPVTVFVILNIVALTTTVFLQIWSTSEKNKGREKNKGNISTSVSFTLYLCLKKDWTRPTFSSNTFSAHMRAHTHALTVLPSLLSIVSSLIASSVEAVCVSVMLLSAHFRHSCVPWECSLLQCIYRQSLSMCLSIGAT